MKYNLSELQEIADTKSCYDVTKAFQDANISFCYVEDITPYKISTILLGENIKYVLKVFKIHIDNPLIDSEGYFIDDIQMSMILDRAFGFSKNSPLQGYYTNESDSSLKFYILVK